MEKTSILCFGDSTIDRILEIDHQEASLICNRRSKEKELCFNYGEKIPIKKIDRSFGGSALNTAVGFDKLGLQTHISTVFGNDSDGKELIGFLNDLNIDLRGSLVVGDTNQSSIIIYEGERTILSYHEKRDYSQVNPPKTDWVYFASAAKGSEAMVKKILQFKNSGTKIAFNPGSWQLKRFDQFLEIAQNCEIFILNKAEADLVLSPDNNIGKQIEKALGMGAKIVMITDAANGAYIGTREETFHMNILATSVIDPTGAGDAFSCAFVGAIINGETPQQAAKWGMINSASAIETIGATSGLLSENQIQDRLAKQNILKSNPI
jgi:sugar/nucleoside kinase (ribokinase family)